MEVCLSQSYKSHDCHMIVSYLPLDPEIATPPLGGTILPGVTRKSLLELGATWVSDRSRTHLF